MPASSAWLYAHVHARRSEAPPVHVPLREPEGTFGGEGSDDSGPAESGRDPNSVLHLSAFLANVVVSHPNPGAISLHH